MIRSSPKEAQHSERGGVLVLVLVVIGALLLFVALVVDTHFQLVQREQSTYYARLAALSAIETYLDKSGPVIDTNLERYDNALTAVQENVSADASTISPGGALEVNRADFSPDQVGLRLEPGTWAIPDPCPNANGRCNAVFTPVPLDKLDAPDFDDEGNRRVGAGGGQVNAFRVVGTARAGLTPLSRALFGAKPQGLGVSVVAAAVPRRGVFMVDLSGSSVADSHDTSGTNAAQYAFAISDLKNASSSAARIWNSMPDLRSNPPPDTDSGDYKIHFKSDYAGILESVNQYFDGSDWLPSGCTKGTDCFIDAGANFQSPIDLGRSSNWNATWEQDGSGAGAEIAVVGNDGAPDNGILSYQMFGDGGDRTPIPFRSPLSPRFVRVSDGFETDPAVREGYRTGTYQMRLANGVADDIGQSYLIDRVSLSAAAGRFPADLDPSDVARRPSAPEPLTSIFDGLNSAMKTFGRRRVAGDQASLIFFDQYVTWNRTTVLSSNFRFLQSITDMRSLGSRKLIHRLGLFPGVTGFTDLPSALQEAMGQLVDPVTGKSTSPYLTSDFIAFVGDGLTNCQACNTSADMESATCTSTGRARCSDAYPYYRQSLNQLGRIFNEPTYGLVANSIQFHVFLVGSSVMPHTMDIRSYTKQNPPTPIPAQGECAQYGGTECQSEAEFRDWYFRPSTTAQLRQSNYVYSPFDFVQGYHDEWSGGFNDNYNWDGKSKDKPFYQANKDFYVFSAAGNGLWAPIRPRDDAACGADRVASTRTGDPGDPSSLRNKCMVPPCERWNGTGYDTHVTLQRTDTSGNVVSGDVARLRTKDPYCRTPSEQMQDYMKQLFASNPYAVVQTEEF